MKILKTDGTFEEQADGPVELHTLQGYVDGYIEVVYLKDGMILVVNEEGIIHNLPLNTQASELAMVPIVGDAVLMKSEFLD